MTTTTSPATSPTSTVPAPVRRRRFTGRQIAVGIGLVVGVGMGVLGIGSTDVAYLEVGDCIESLPDGDISALQTVACDSEHVAEVVGAAESVTGKAAASALCAPAFGRFADVETASPLTGTTYQGEDGRVLCLVVGEGLTAPLEA